jgi:hypothetical protein
MSEKLDSPAHNE